jgi:hypothetical protein
MTPRQSGGAFSCALRGIAMPYSSEQIRSLLLQYLKSAMKNNRRFRPQIRELIQGLHHYVSRDGEAPGQPFAEADDRKVFHVVWDLVFDRVMIPGLDDPGIISGGDWPFLTITEHGRRVIEEARPTPYDPDGYLANLNTVAGGLHYTALRYVQEAVATFRARCYLASAVMLGAASERIFTELSESIGNSIADPAKQTSFRDKALKGKMRNRVNTVTGWCRNSRAQLVGEWAEEERVEVIDRLAHFIRSRRNDAGHPQDPPAVPTHEETYASLVVFPDYCKWLYELKSNLDTRPGGIT